MERLGVLGIVSDNQTSQTQSGTAEMTALPALSILYSVPASIAPEIEAAVDLARAEKSEATRHVIGHKERMKDLPFLALEPRTSALVNAMVQNLRFP
jgi:hypothetical protein